MTLYEKLLDEATTNEDGLFEVVAGIVWVVVSDSDPGQLYWITKMPLKPGIKFSEEDFVWTCSCMGYRMSTFGLCKHIKTVQDV